MGIHFLELQKISKKRTNKIKLYWLLWNLRRNNEVEKIEKVLLVNETMYSLFSLISAYANSITDYFSNKQETVLF